MHKFYQRIQTVFQQAGSNRNRFCKKYGYNYQTLQAYWNTDKLPPGNVIQDLAKEFNVSLDTLVLGRRAQDVPIENPIVGRITRFLEQQDDESLLRIEGALKMLRYMTLFGSPYPPTVNEDGKVITGYKYPENDVNLMPQKTEKAMSLLTELAKHLKQANMSQKDRELSKEMLNQIILNIYEREVKDEWANLEEVAEDRNQNE